MKVFIAEYNEARLKRKTMDVKWYEQVGVKVKARFKEKKLDAVTVNRQTTKKQYDKLVKDYTVRLKWYFLSRLQDHVSRDSDVLLQSSELEGSQAWKRSKDCD